MCSSATVWEYAVLEGRSEISRDGQGYMKSPYPHFLHGINANNKKMGNDKDVLVDLDRLRKMLHFSKNFFQISSLNDVL
jgi:hypothetical protein